VLWLGNARRLRSLAGSRKARCASLGHSVR
jgi:hypothetical protein